MTVKEVSVLISFYLFIAVSGELVQESSLVCANDAAIYKCTGYDILEWTWTNSDLSLSEHVGILPNLIPTGIRNRTIGGTTVSFNITDVGPPVINVIATVYNPQVLNGTRIECGGQSLIISITKLNFLLTALRVSKNGTELRIVPNVERNISNIQYQISGGNRMFVMIPIIMSSSDNLTFTLCGERMTFTIDTCLLDDDSDDNRAHALFSNGTWVISRSCGDIQVNCLSNKSWSMDISCPAVTHPNTAANSTELASKAISSTTNQKFTEMATATCSQAYNMSEFQRYAEVIGSVMGTFVVAHILGIVFGLVCGIKYTQRNIIAKQFKENSNAEPAEVISNGPLYEEVELDKAVVELSPNISYDVVKKL